MMKIPFGLTDAESAAFIENAGRLSIEPPPSLSAVRRLLATVTAAGANPFAGYAIGRELDETDSETETSLAGVDFLFAKMGGTERPGGEYVDLKFNYHAQVSQNLGVPLVGTWASGPRCFFENGMTRGNVDTCPDENHPVMKPLLTAWHSGTRWKNVRELVVRYDETSYLIDRPYTVDSQWMKFYIDDMRNRLYSRVKADPYFKNFYFSILSRRSFVESMDTDDYSIQKYLISRPEIGVVTARYPRAIPAGTTAATVRSSYIPPADTDPLVFGWTAERVKPWQFWRFAGKPGPAWIIANGTRAELFARYAMIDGGPVEPPVEPPPPPVVKKYWAVIHKEDTRVRVRTTPDATNLDNVAFTGMPVGVKIPVDNVDTLGPIVWAHLDGYIAIQTATDKFADLTDRE
jgi:hypothetical protein